MTHILKSIQLTPFTYRAPYPYQNDRNVLEPAASGIRVPGDLKFNLSSGFVNINLFYSFFTIENFTSLSGLKKEGRGI